MRKIEHKWQKCALSSNYNILSLFAPFGSDRVQIFLVLVQVWFSSCRTCMFVFMNFYYLLHNFCVIAILKGLWEKEFVEIHFCCFATLYLLLVMKSGRKIMQTWQNCFASTTAGQFYLESEKLERYELYL